MTQERKLLVGFDLCNDFSQISCYSKKSFEPESICYTDDDTNYMIPTVLGVRKDTKEWLFGEDAIDKTKLGQAVLVDQLVERICKREEFYVFDVKIAPEAILERFFRKCLSLLKRYYPNDMVAKLVVTVPVLDITLIKTIYKALEALSLEKDRVSVQSHTQSAVNFAMSQNRDLWMNDVGIFDFEENGLQYYQLKVNRKHVPMSIMLTHKDLSDTLSFDLLEDLDDKESLSYIFENVAKSVLYKQLVTTLYMTGKGFEGSWADAVFKNLCTGRRVFKGQNLYTKGACYYARQLSGEGKTEDYIYITEEMVKSSISVALYKDAQLHDYTLVEAGTLWYEANCQIQLILDDIAEIVINVQDLYTKEVHKHEISLEGLEKRPSKMTRIEFRLACSDSNTCLVTVKDMGFGEFYPSTNQIFQQPITLSY
ncbi:DUF5716 family protein [Anaerosporobacter sp.]|uniref:DUF5716 family protein n=1 Tax=Anaerosporobacter sp. TaxID=1872529 RepID=UPI00286F9BEF|nr:DUF5716 family protein [Anaerosporobacter sp.]